LIVRDDGKALIEKSGVPGQVLGAVACSELESLVPVEFLARTK